MTTIRRRPQPKAEVPATVWFFLLFFVVVMFVILMPDAPAVTPSIEPGKNHTVGVKEKLMSWRTHRRDELQKALHSLTEANIPYRLRALRDRHEIIGERLAEISSGKETVEELLHGVKKDVASDKPPMELEEVINYLDGWIHQLHETLMQAKDATFEGIWTAYHDLAVKTLYPWDREYLSRMPPRRDGEFFWFHVHPVLSGIFSLFLILRYSLGWQHFRWKHLPQHCNIQRRELFQYDSLGL